MAIGITAAPVAAFAVGVSTLEIHATKAPHASSLLKAGASASVRGHPCSPSLRANRKRPGRDLRGEFWAQVNVG